MSSVPRAPAEESFENLPDDLIRDIHALTPPHPTIPYWEAPRPSSSEGGTSENNFGSMSREFNALLLGGSTIANQGSMDLDVNGIGGGGDRGGRGNGNDLGRIREEEETNPLAIVRNDLGPIDPVPYASPQPHPHTDALVGGGSGRSDVGEAVMVHRVRKEEIESKIHAWKTGKISKINNRFRREDAVIHGWEGVEVQKATSWMKKTERKLEDKRAKALEKMQNDVAKAHQKAEERRASAEANRGTKVARVLEIANLMKTLGRPPSKSSFFKST